MKKIFVMLSFASLIIAGCNQAAQKTDNSAAADSQSRQAIIDSVNAANQQQKTNDSLNAIATQKTSEPVRRSHEERRTTTTSTTTPATTAPVTTTTQPATTTTTAPATTTATTTTTQKKGMSATGKGAIIGTGVGAITGAIISKHHKAGGALIGGLLGAGAGAGTGAIIQKKKNRDTLQ